MWKRIHVEKIKAIARQFPAVLILGPRQVGKTTLARVAFPKAPYLDMEQPGTRQLFAADPLFQIESRLPGKTGALARWCSMKCSVCRKCSRHCAD